MFLKYTHKQFLFGTGFSGAYFLVRPPSPTSPCPPRCTLPARIKPYALTVRTVWLAGDGAYSYALGQFRPEGGGH